MFSSVLRQYGGDDSDDDGHDRACFFPHNNMLATLLEKAKLFHIGHRTPQRNVMARYGCVCVCVPWNKNSSLPMILCNVYHAGFFF
jgi:hypothetical protein